MALGVVGTGESASHHSNRTHVLYEAYHELRPGVVQQRPRVTELQQSVFGEGDCDVVRSDVAQKYDLRELRETLGCEED